MFLYLGRHAFVLYRLTHSRNLALADSLNIAFKVPLHTIKMWWKSCPISQKDFLLRNLPFKNL